MGLNGGSVPFKWRKNHSFHPRAPRFAETQFRHDFVMLRRAQVANARTGGERSESQLLGTVMLMRYVEFNAWSSTMKKSALALGAAAVAAMIAAPVAAAERYSAPFAGESELGGGDNSGIIVAAIALATVIAGVFIIVDDDDAVSP